MTYIMALHGQFARAGAIAFVGFNSLASANTELALC